MRRRRVQVLRRRRHGRRPVSDVRRRGRFEIVNGDRSNRGRGRCDMVRAAGHRQPIDRRRRFGGYLSRVTGPREYREAQRKVHQQFGRAHRGDADGVRARERAGGSPARGGRVLPADRRLETGTADGARVRLPYRVARARVPTTADRSLTAEPRAPSVFITLATLRMLRASYAFTLVPPARSQSAIARRRSSAAAEADETTGKTNDYNAQAFTGEQLRFGSRLVGAFGPRAVRPVSATSTRPQTSYPGPEHGGNVARRGPVTRAVPARTYLARSVRVASADSPCFRSLCETFTAIKQNSTRTTPQPRPGAWCYWGGSGGVVMGLIPLELYADLYICLSTHNSDILGTTTCFFPSFIYKLLHREYLRVWSVHGCL